MTKYLREDDDFMGIFVFWGAIYIAYKIVTEEWGNGDYYRSVGDMYRKQGNKDAAKYQYKKAGDSDLAVGCSVIFLGIVIIIVIAALINS